MSLWIHISHIISFDAFITDMMQLDQIVFFPLSASLLGGICIWAHGVTNRGVITDMATETICDCGVAPANPVGFDSLI